MNNIHFEQYFGLHFWDIVENESFQKMSFLVIEQQNEQIRTMFIFVQI